MPARLDAPPPLPPEVAQSQPSIAGLAGEVGQAPTTGGMHRTVVERVMMVDKQLRDLVGIMPELSGLVDDVAGRLRAGVARALASASEGGGNQRGPAVNAGGVLTNLLASPVGPPQR